MARGALCHTLPTRQSRLRSSIEISTPRLEDAWSRAWFQYSPRTRRGECRMTKFSMTMFALATMTGVATAQPKQADPKAGAPAVATPAPEMGKPPAEIKAMLKQMGARQTCTGTGLGPDMKSEVK